MQLASAPMFFLVLQGIFQTPLIFACAGFSAMSDPDNLEGSAFGVFFDVFCSSKMLAFHLPVSLGVSAILVASAYLEEFCWDFLVPCSLSTVAIIQSSCMGCFVTASDVPGSLFPDFCYHRLVTKKVP